jgi:hypothetical protein
LTENITKEYKDESNKNKVQPNFTTFDQTVNEPNNSKDETHIESVGDTPVKIVYDSKWDNDYSTAYDLRKESSHNIKREYNELFYGTDSNVESCSMIITL